MRAFALICSLAAAGVIAHSVNTGILEERGGRDNFLSLVDAAVAQSLANTIVDRHGQYSCTSQFKLHGGKSCTCQSIPNPGNGHVVCEEPKTTKCGKALCNQGRCEVQCNDNMQYNPRSGDCECIPGCFKHNSGTHCIPNYSGVPKNPYRGGHGKKRSLTDGNPLYLTRRDSSVYCPAGEIACPITSAFDSGMECVETAQSSSGEIIPNTLENCGACNKDEESADCTKIVGAEGIGCDAGKCVVFSCTRGYRLSASMDACVPSLF